MDPTIQPPRNPNFALYQKEQFKLSQQGLHPPFNTHPDKLEAQAKEKLSHGGYLYASCNAGVGWTHKANREGERLQQSDELMGAFERWKIVPRMLVDTTARDTTIELFGHKISAPILLSPVGVNKVSRDVSGEWHS
jgi:isopentenyl diphosphate isomerase/L-lactate dehydrogenase-like FMN-dependent dehydrogenase